MVFTMLNLSSRLAGWEQSRAVLDFQFSMQPPGWMLHKAATAGVKFEREKFAILLTRRQVQAITIHWGVLHQSRYL